MAAEDLVLPDAPVLRWVAFCAELHCVRVGASGSLRMSLAVRRRCLCATSQPAKRETRGQRKMGGAEVFMAAEDLVPPDAPVLRWVAFHATRP